MMAVMAENFTAIPDDKTIEKTMASLANNGMTAIVVNTEDEARKAVLDTIPQGAEVMTMSSVTLQTLGLDKEINDSGRYGSTRKLLATMDRKTRGLEMNGMGAAPQWAVGSVHAVTQNGEILVASATGSQIPAYVYGAQHVLWVIGAQKIVTDLDEGLKRIYDYVLARESERVKQAYGWPGSSVNKLLIVNRENTEGRVKIIFVKKVLGF